MTIIPRQGSVALPDFCNLGVMLRVLLLVNGLLAFVALAQSRPFDAALWIQAFLAAAAGVEPVLIASLALLCPLRRLLRRAGYGVGILAIVLLELLLMSGVRALSPGGLGGGATVLHDWLLTLVCTALVLFYFNLRERAFSPALAEARLQALQARIRPHFLFNSLTAVLSLIRSEPRRAEEALENLADLFRVLLREQRKLVPLHEEIELCQRYLQIETLRLGERLAVAWQVDDEARDSAMPPLILQPLVENAVHHGIEPSHRPAVITIRIARHGSQVTIDIANPMIEGNTQARGKGGMLRPGNHMALDNVRERLALHFDVEAQLETESGAGEYRVRIVVPYRRYEKRDQENRRDTEDTDR